MATYQEMLEWIAESTTYAFVTSINPRGDCGRCSRELRDILDAHGEPSLLLGSGQHYFLVTETSDQGVMLLDITAHQFNLEGENGPESWIFMPIRHAIESILALEECTIKRYWLNDIPVVEKDFSPAYGVDLTPEEKLFLGRVEEAIAQTAMTVVYGITPESSKAAARRIVEDCMVPVEMLPEGSNKSWHLSNDTNFVPLSPLYIHDAETRKDLANRCDIFRAYSHTIDKINAVMQSDFCPAAFKGKAVELHDPALAVNKPATKDR